MKEIDAGSEVLHDQTPADPRAAMRDSPSGEPLELGRDLVWGECRHASLARGAFFLNQLFRRLNRHGEVLSCSLFKPAEGIRPYSTPTERLKRTTRMRSPEYFYVPCRVAVEIGHQRKNAAWLSGKESHAALRVWADCIWADCIWAEVSGQRLERLEK